jgi:hypothetical protein
MPMVVARGLLSFYEEKAGQPRSSQWINRRRRRAQSGALDGVVQANAQSAIAEADRQATAGRVARAASWTDGQGTSELT